MATRRQRRVAEQIHRDLSLLLMREVRDPRLGDVTITEVRITPDLEIARVFFTVLGDEDERREAQAGLASAAGFLRSQLAGQLRLRTVPELVFELDRSAEYGQRIEDLLSQIAAEHPEDDGSEVA